jgi:hypothetical protein
MNQTKFKKESSTMRTLTRCTHLLLLALACAPAVAVPVYTGGAGGVSFGVTPYGAPVPGVPTYILNLNDGRLDILSSPGGTFLTANPVIGNNITSFGPAPLPGFGTWIGGGNGWGPFGIGTIAINGPSVNFSMTDPIAGGGSASYGIGSWSASFFEPVGYAGGFGSFLSIAGRVPAVGNAAVAALRTHITSANPASPFFGGGLGIDLPQLVLADSHVAPGVFSWVALGGSGAAMLTDPFANFRGLAINNAPIVIPAGDVFTAQSTLTIYADPATFDAYYPLSDSELIAATGASLPNYGIVTVPEPGTGLLLLLGVLAALGCRKWNQS